MDIEIVSGFLGSGKTTFINKYLPVLDGRTAVIENEFGDVGLDTQLLPSGIPVREISAGCICCSLALDFRQGIRSIAQEWHPDRIIIEPSGVGRLSDIIKACTKAKEKDGVELRLTKLIVLVDAASFEEDADGFGEFYLDQIRNGRLILLSNLEELTPADQKRIITRMANENPQAVIYRSDWRLMEPEALRELVRLATDYEPEPAGMKTPGLPADKVFASIALTDIAAFDEAEVEKMTAKLMSGEYGQILRGKGFLPLKNGSWVHLNITRSASSQDVFNEKVESKMIIIGCDLKEKELQELFAC